jgi:hypothetical protein
MDTTFRIRSFLFFISLFFCISALAENTTYGSGSLSGNVPVEADNNTAIGEDTMSGNMTSHQVLGSRNKVIYIKK